MFQYGRGSTVLCYLKASIRILLLKDGQSEEVGVSQHQERVFLQSFINFHYPFIWYSTKLLRDKTFVVRSPCEYLQKHFCVCIKTTSTSAKKFMGEHSRFKQNLQKS